MRRNWRLSSPLKIEFTETLMQPHIEHRNDQEKQDFYEIYKGELTNENNNLNQRVIWNIFAQAGLFGAYAGVLGAPKEIKSALFGAQLDLLVWALPVMSLLVGALTIPVIYASIKYMHGVRDDYQQRAGSSPAGRPPLMGRPGSRWLTVLADYTPLLIPSVIVLAWLILLMGQIVNALLNTAS
jgi:hypothetical protein